MDGSTKPQLNTQTSSSHTEVLLSTTKRSRDGEEQSTPAVKRRHVHKNSPSGLESESVHSESVTLTGYISYQHQHDDSTFQPPSQLHLPLPQVGHHPFHQHQHQPPFHLPTYRSQLYAPLQLFNPQNSKIPLKSFYPATFQAPDPVHLNQFSYQPPRWSPSKLFPPLLSITVQQVMRRWVGTIYD